MSYGAKSYKSTSIQTATPEQVLLMLYEGAIKATKLAKLAIEKKNMAEKGKQIGKVHDILMELSNTLDHSKSPDVSGQLSSLYDFCIAQLFKANMENDANSLDSVVKVLTTLYEGWVSAVQEIRKTAKKEKT